MSSPYEWDDDPWIDADQEHRRRRWHHAWHSYVAVLVAAIGVILAIGSVAAPGRTTVGGVLVVLAAVAIVASDGRRQRAGRPPPPPPTLRWELSWLGAAVVLAVVGWLLFAL
jgi:hypothetical protein